MLQPLSLTKEVILKKFNILPTIHVGRTKAKRSNEKMAPLVPIAKGEAIPKTNAGSCMEGLHIWVKLI